MARSKNIKSLFKTTGKRDVPPKILWVSRTFGVLAAVFLVTGLISPRPLLNMVGATLGFYAMIWICTGYEWKTNKGRNKLLGSTLMRDIALTIAWAFLMIPWLLEIIHKV